MDRREFVLGAGAFAASLPGASRVAAAASRRLALDERASANVVIAPMLPEHYDMKNATLGAMIDAGEAAGRGALPKVRALFGSGRIG